MKHFLAISIITANIFASAIFGMEDSPELTKRELDANTKLRMLEETRPEKVFIRGLPYQKNESQKEIVKRLAALPDAITIDDKNGTITIEGPLIEAFVINKQQELARQNLPAQATESPSSSPSPPIIKKKKSNNKVRFTDEKEIVSIAPEEAKPRTSYEILMAADPATVTIVRGTEIITYTLDEKIQLLAGLRSAIEAVEERNEWEEHSKEIVVNVAKLTKLPSCKEQIILKEKTIPTFTQQLFSRGALATGAVCLAIGYLLAKE